MPIILRIDPSNPDPKVISEAGQILKKGGLCIFPTETVYGLGFDIRNPETTTRLENLKHRPALPLMAHCSNESQLNNLVAEISENGRLLMDRFWPGPLALIFKKSSSVPESITAGFDTIGIRMVSNPVARKLIAELSCPIAATSANLHQESTVNEFGKISTSLLNQVDVAIDAGIAGKGKPSTIIDITREPPVLLRLGAVPSVAIEAVLGCRLARPSD